MGPPRDRRNIATGLRQSRCKQSADRTSANNTDLHALRPCLAGQCIINPCGMGKHFSVAVVEPDKL